MPLYVTPGQEVPNAEVVELEVGARLAWEFWQAWAYACRPAWDEGDVGDSFDRNGWRLAHRAEIMRLRAEIERAGARGAL